MLIIDIYHGNNDKTPGGVIDFVKIKNFGVDAVWIKATQGIGYKDPCYKKNLDGALKAGLMAGGYHFWNKNEDPEAQFKNFKSVMDTQGRGNLIGMFDWESFSALKIATQEPAAQKFMELFKATYPEKLPPVYTGAWCFDTIGAPSSYFTQFPLWMSDYRTTVQGPRMVKTWQNWTIWQYSESGRLPGIGGGVDMNKFIGSMDDFKKLFFIG